MRPPRISGLSGEPHRLPYSIVGGIPILPSPIIRYLIYIIPPEVAAFSTKVEQFSDEPRAYAYVTCMLGTHLAEENESSPAVDELWPMTERYCRYDLASRKVVRGWIAGLRILTGRVAPCHSLYTWRMFNFERMKRFHSYTTGYQRGRLTRSDYETWKGSDI